MATRTISNTGGNWSSTGAWVEGSVPTSADAVVATATSGPLTVTAGATCLSLVLTGYTSTMNITGGLTVASTITLAGTVTASATTHTLTWGSAGTHVFTSNGIAWPCALYLTAASTHTITGALSIAGLLTLSPGTRAVSGSALTLSGGMYDMTSTTTFNMIVTVTGGTLSANGTNVGATCPEIKLAGTVFIGTFWGIKACRLTYVSGTVATGGSTLYLLGACTVDTGGSVTWGTVTPALTGSCALASDMHITNLVVGSACSFSSTTYKLYVHGNVTTGGTTYYVTGTSEIVLCGTGTINTSTSALQINTTIDTEGTITITQLLFGGSKTLKYVAGTVIVNGFLRLTSACTLNVPGIQWGELNLSYGSTNITFTLAADLNCGLLSITGTGASTNMTGAYTLTCGVLGFNSGTVFKFNPSVTVVITDRIYAAGAETSTSVASVGSTSTTPVSIRYNGPLSGLRVIRLALSYIDASGGATPIYTHDGAVTNCSNVVAYNCSQLAIDSFGSF